MNIQQFLKYVFIYIFLSIDIQSSISLLEKNLEKIEKLKK